MELEGCVTLKPTMISGSDQNLVTCAVMGETRRCNHCPCTASGLPAKNRQAEGRRCGMSCTDEERGERRWARARPGWRGPIKATSGFCEHHYLLFHYYVNRLLQSTTVLPLAIRKYVQTGFYVLALMIKCGTICYVCL